MIEPQIRPAKYSDVEALATIRAESLDIAPSALMEIFDLELATRLRDSNWMMFVAEIDNSVVAYGRCEKHDGSLDNLYGTISPLPSGWYLRGIAVLRRYQRSGIATALTSARLDWLDQKTLTAYCFLDSDEKISIPLYVNCGFVEISRDWKFSDPTRLDTGILFKRTHP
jgi:GNAT superfamily N-acetyltransferase